VVVDIEPDYDKPSMLVVYHYALADDVTLPASLELLIPISAKNSINAVAIPDSNGNLVYETYTTRESGDYSVISMQTSSRNIQVEYYDAYIKSGDTRSYSYTWPGNYPVDAFSVSFLQPLDSSNLKLTPDMGAGTTDANGLVYFLSAIGTRTANQTFTQEISYQKTSTRLSASVQTVQPTAPVTSSSMMTLYWILGGIGGLLLVAAVVFGVITWRKNDRKTRRDNRRRHAIAPKKESLTGDVYCNQCGKRAQPGDVFCRTCGSRLQSG